MSIAFSDDTLFMQRLLKLSNINPGPLDGYWGPKTDKAYNEFENKAHLFKAALGSYDSRTEQNIATLCLQAQELARKFLHQFKLAGLDVRIISGTRTYTEQNGLFARGRTKAGTIVTNAKGGSSNHNFGLAWDIGLFSEGAYLKQASDYIAAHNFVAELKGLEWGGFWASFPDYSHYQYYTGLSIAQTRNMFERGNLTLL